MDGDSGGLAAGSDRLVVGYAPHLLPGPRRDRGQLRRSAIMLLVVGGLLLLLALLAVITTLARRAFGEPLIGVVPLALVGVVLASAGARTMRTLRLLPGDPVRFLPPFVIALDRSEAHLPPNAQLPSASWPIAELVARDVPWRPSRSLARATRLAAAETGVPLQEGGRALMLGGPGGRPRIIPASVLDRAPSEIVARIDAFRAGGPGSTAAELRAIELGAEAPPAAQEVGADGDPGAAPPIRIGWSPKLLSPSQPGVLRLRVRALLLIVVGGMLGLLIACLLLLLLIAGADPLQCLATLAAGLALGAAPILAGRFALNRIMPDDSVEMLAPSERYAMLIDGEVIRFPIRFRTRPAPWPILETRASVAPGRFQLLRRARSRELLRLEREGQEPRELPAWLLDRSPSEVVALIDEAKARLQARA